MSENLQLGSHVLETVRHSLQFYHTYIYLLEWNGKAIDYVLRVVHFAFRHNQTGLRGFYDIHFAIHFTADVLFLLRDETVCNSAQDGRFVDVHATLCD